MVDFQDFCRIEKETLSQRTNNMTNPRGICLKVYQNEFKSQDLTENPPPQEDDTSFTQIQF